MLSNNKYLFYILFLITYLHTSAQKKPYIPEKFGSLGYTNGAQFSWSKTVQSDNFTLIWGDYVDEPFKNSKNKKALTFNSTACLDTLEKVYAIYKKTGFIDDSQGTNLSLYKIPVVLSGTFGNESLSNLKASSLGSSVDGKIAIIYINPLSLMNGANISIVMAYAFQSQLNIDFRLKNNLGFPWMKTQRPYTGFVGYEGTSNTYLAGTSGTSTVLVDMAHAYLMNILVYPYKANSSTIDLHHIEGWFDWKNCLNSNLLQLAILESEGMSVINQIWKETVGEEFFLDTYKKVRKYTQSQLNDKMFEHVRRMATLDFNYSNVGASLRQNRYKEFINYIKYQQSIHTILKQDSLDSKHFRVPIELAPEEYGYNVIPLHPIKDSSAIIVKFKGNKNVNKHTGWRYGFAVANDKGELVKYGNVYGVDSEEFGIKLKTGETQLFLVVMGAPLDKITTDIYNSTWMGYPKHYRHPYELYISGAFPEGYQNLNAFRARWKIYGKPHPNGGGWVQTSCKVDSTVYVGPKAIILNKSVITGNVKILNTAIVSRAKLSDRVIVKDNAFVFGGIIKDDVVIKGQAYAENDTISDDAVLLHRANVRNYKLSGNVQVGGDVVVFNYKGDCSKGVYYTLTNFFENNLLESDKRKASSPANKDVNDEIIPFNTLDLKLTCNFKNIETCLKGKID